MQNADRIRVSFLTLDLRIRHLSARIFLGRMTNKIRWRRLDHRGRQPRFPIVDAAHELTLHVVHELVHLALHLLDLAAHVQDDLDARQVDAEVSGQRTATPPERKNESSNA